MSPKEFEGRYNLYCAGGPRPCTIVRKPDMHTCVPQFALSFDDDPQPRPAMTGPVRSLATFPLSYSGPLETLEEGNETM